MFKWLFGEKDIIDHDDQEYTLKTPVQTPYEVLIYNRNDELIETKKFDDGDLFYEFVNSVHGIARYPFMHMFGFGTTYTVRIYPKFFPLDYC